MELSDFFQRFQLEILSTDWVKSVWNEEFPSPLELPADYEMHLEFNLIDIIKDTRRYIRQWLDDPYESLGSSVNSSTSSNPKSWNALVTKTNHKSLLCILSSLMTQYSNENDEMNKERACEAVRLYFTMVSIDGAHIFQVYNSTVFSQALEVFNIVNCLNSNNATNKAATKGRKRKHPAGSSENGEPEQPFLSGEEMRKILSLTISLLESLYYCLSKFSLRNDPDAISSLIPVLVQLAGIEKSTSSLFDQVPSKGTTAYLAHLAYKNINVLCSEFHGQVDESLRALVKALISPLSIYNLPSLQTVSRESQIVKDHTVKFIIKLVSTVGEPCYNRVTALLQQICIGILDKADIRVKYVQLIVDLITQFPPKLYYKIVLWIVSMCFGDSVKHRLSGLEIVTKLLSLPDKAFTYEGSHSDSHISNGRRANSGRSTSLNSRASVNSGESLGHNQITLHVNHRLLFAVILSRCKDVSPRVRAKSLAVLAPLILSKDLEITEIIEEIFFLSINTDDQPVKDLYDFSTFFRCKLFEKEDPVDPIPSCSVLLKLFERLTQDEKVFVRKNSLHVIANICLLHPSYLEKSRLELLVYALKDLSVGIRKMTVQCLTDLLLKYPEHPLLPSCWVEGVVPLFGENDVKAQEKVLEIAEMVILDNIVPYNKVSTPEHKLPWLIISLISKHDMRKLFKFACGFWCNSDKIKDQFIKCLYSYIGTENNLAAWYFLVCLSDYKDLQNPTPILEYFYANVHQVSRIDRSCSPLVMSALVSNAKRLPLDKQEELSETLKKSLSDFKIPLPLITASIDIIHMYDFNSTKQWAKSLIPVCENKAKRRLDKIKKMESSVIKSDELFCRFISTMAELSLICPDVVSKETYTMLMDIVDIASWEHATLSIELAKMGKLHAVTVCVLGKLCLQNRITAKTVVPILGNLVGVNSPKQVKVNANIALSDLCVRFSSLVEPYFGDMCVCLKDPNQDVRRNILTLITSLVQEDFLKIRANVLIYLLSMIKDSSKEIRDFTLSFIMNSVMKKMPNIMFQHFLKAILFLNNFEGMASSNVQDVVSPQEKAAFCLTGIQHMESRREIYRFMLTNMLDEMKFKTRYNICVEILDPVSEGEIPLEGEGVNVLKDSLYILGCEEIKMSARRSEKDQDDEDEEREPVAFAKRTIMSQLFSSLMKKTLTDYIVPLIIKLKRKLMSLNSPLVRDLMLSLREMLKDFKEQVDEILAADPELAAEVAHDLAQWEKEEKERNLVLSPTQEEAQQDSIMAEMKKVAHRISIGVLRHGPSIIPPQSTQETSQELMNTSSSSEARLRMASDAMAAELENINLSPVVRLENVVGIENQASRTSVDSSPSSSVSSLSSLSSRGSRSNTKSDK